MHGKAQKVKICLCVLFSLICFCLAIYLRQGLKAYYDMFCISYSGMVEALQIEEWELEGRLLMYRQKHQQARQGGRVNNDVTLYYCSGSAPELLGMNITFGSRQFAEGTALIDEELAWQLFSSADCAGKTIKAGGKSYTISGVYKTPGALAAYDKHAVYLNTGGAAANTASADTGETVFIGKAREGQAMLILSRLERSGNYILKAVSIDSIARTGYFAAGLLLVLGMLLVFAACAKQLCQLAKNSTCKKNGIRQFLKTGGVQLLAAAISLILICILLPGLKFSIDTRFIPRSLIEISAYKDSISSWLRMRNQTYLNGGLVDSVLRVQCRLSLLMCIIFIFSVMPVKRFIKNRLA